MVGVHQFPSLAEAALPDDLLDDAAPAKPDAVATGADDSTGEAAP